jgi:hypothetical protein
MAIYKVSCGHCGDNNIHDASSSDQSLEKHSASKAHIEAKAKFDEGLKKLTNFTHGKEHN